MTSLSNAAAKKVITVSIISDIMWWVFLFSYTNLTAPS
jgi:hypothetical protein